METLAVINQKGGTGKTTTAINLGCALGAMGSRVLILDLDPQASLTYSAGIRDPELTVLDVLQGERPLSDVLVPWETVTIAPACRELAEYEAVLVSKIGRENVLKNALRGLTGYDYVLIDSPPSLSVLTVNALNAASEVLIPLQMEILSLQGLTMIWDTLDQLRTGLRHRVRVRGIVPSMYDGRRRLSGEILEAVKASTREYVYETTVRVCVKIAEAPSFAKSVLTYAPRSNGALDFVSLAKEFIAQGGKYANREERAQAA
jgi:chromosome partitioning protein